MSSWDLGSFHADWPQLSPVLLVSAFFCCFFCALWCFVYRGRWLPLPPTRTPDSQRAPAEGKSRGTVGGCGGAAGGGLTLSLSSCCFARRRRSKTPETHASITLRGASASPDGPSTAPPSQVSLSLPHF